MAIKCCNGCVAPKRHFCCWSDCTEYKKERAELDAQQEAARKKREVDNHVANFVNKQKKSHRSRGDRCFGLAHRATGILDIPEEVT